MKRFLSLVLAMLIAITMLIIPASAENYATAVVKGGWLRLRAEASASSETISAYFTGTQVTIIGTSGEWYYVLTPDGHYGFMNSNYLTVTGSSSGSTTTESTAYIYAANGKPVRMRSGPSTDYGVIASYSVGTQVKVLISGADWSKIRVGTRTGYIMSKFLSVTNITPSTPSSSYTAYVTASNGKPVRMRSGPSTDYGVIASYSVGTQVKVLISGADWSKIRVGTRTGYIMSKFLSVTNITPSTPSSSYTAYVTASNGKPVRMRTGAGTNYSVISTYSVGTQVTVLEYGKTWCRIRVNGYTGYMMTKFLTTTQPTIISSAALNKNTVWPGETLTVTTNPANVSVSYEWLNDAGARLGTGSTYTVKTSDTGRRIRVRVTGKNGTTGSVVSGWAAVQGNGTVGTVYQLKALTLNTTNAVVGTTLTATIAPSGATANIYWYLDNGTYLGYGSSYTVTATDVGHRIYAWAQGTGSTSGNVTSPYTQQVTAGASYRIDSVTLNSLNPIVGQTLVASVAPYGATATITWYRDDSKILSYGATYTVQADDIGYSIYVWAEGTGNTTGSATSKITSEVKAN